MQQYCQDTKQSELDSLQLCPADPKQLEVQVCSSLSSNQIKTTQNIPSASIEKYYGHPLTFENLNKKSWEYFIERSPLFVDRN